MTAVIGGQPSCTLADVKNHGESCLSLSKPKNTAPTTTCSLPTGHRPVSQPSLCVAVDDLVGYKTLSDNNRFILTAGDDETVLVQTDSERIKGSERADGYETSYIGDKTIAPRFENEVRIIREPTFSLRDCLKVASRKALSSTLSVCGHETFEESGTGTELS